MLCQPGADSLSASAAGPPELGQSDKEPEIVLTHLMEGISLALDLKGGRMFITDFGFSVYSANLEGSNPRTLPFAEGNLTGIAYAEVPSGYRQGAKASCDQANSRNQIRDLCTPYSTWRFRHGG